MAGRKQLTPKQMAFCEAYAACFNPLKSAEYAGYEPANDKYQLQKAAYRALGNENVKMYINELLEEKRKCLQTVPFQAIIQNLVEITMDEDVNTKDKLRASELLIKYKNTNSWEGAETRHVEAFIEALRGEIKWDENE